MTADTGFSGKVEEIGGRVLAKFPTSTAEGRPIMDQRTGLAVAEAAAQIIAEYVRADRLASIQATKLVVEAKIADARRADQATIDRLREQVGRLRQDVEDQRRLREVAEGLLRRIS
jgi:hypothetical protein